MRKLQTIGWRISRVLATLSVLALVGAHADQASAQAVRGNPGFTTNTLSPNDDSSVGPVVLPFSVDFFGLVFNQLWVNNNGNVTFDGALSAYTPFDLTSTGSEIIAPFFADVDTRPAGSGVVTYGVDTVNGRTAFGVNWIDVGHFSQNTNNLNSFQLVMVDRSDVAPGSIDFEFNYDTIAWEAGDASGGTDGLGGSSARAGFSNGTGDPGTFFELNGSAINGAFLDTNPSTGLALNSNIGVPGRYLFEVRGSVIEVCGDGILTGAEECDDGNSIGGDCCSPSCTLDAPGVPCDDGEVCTDGDSCDGSGTCLSGGPLDCDDGRACTVDSCESGVGCVTDPEPPACTEGFEKALLIVKEKKQGREKLTLKLLKGPAASQLDFGDPIAGGGTAYEICVFSNGLVGELRVDRAGDDCSGKPCWRSIGGDVPDGKGYSYKDKSTDADGVKVMKLKGGGEGKTKLLIKAQNNSAQGQLNLPTGMTLGLAGTTAALVQFHTSEGACYGAQLLDVKKADAEFFKAK